MTPAVALALETLVVFSGVPEHAGSEVWLTRSRSKNSGGRIAPAAIAGLIEGRFPTVNAFPAVIRTERAIVIAQVSCWRGCISQPGPVSPAGLEANRQQGDA
jgi:hypothetical protein